MALRISLTIGIVALAGFMLASAVGCSSPSLPEFPDTTEEHANSFESHTN